MEFNDEFRLFAFFDVVERPHSAHDADIAVLSGIGARQGPQRRYIHRLDSSFYTTRWRRRRKADQVDDRTSSNSVRSQR